LATAQKEPSLALKDLLASKLESYSTLQEAEEPCDSARIQLCDIAQPRPKQPDRLQGRSLPGLRLHERVAPIPVSVENRVGTIQNESTCLRLHEEVAPTCLPLHEEVGFHVQDRETSHLLDLARIQSVTRREARQAASGENPQDNKTSEDLLAKILELQGKDPLCMRLKKEISTKISTKSQAGTSTCSGRDGRKGYILGQNGLLLYEGRVVVPAQKALTQELLYLYHDDQLAGHWGIEKTRELLERKFYWPTLVVDVREYVTTCFTCQNIAISRHKPYGKLESLPVPEGPWQEVSLDFITQLPSSYIGTKEYDAILVVVDRYTKMARFIPTITNIAAPEFAALFHENIELKYGSPRGIVSDRDTRITSKFWAEICAYSLIKRKLSTAFHPQTDGQTEILNRILENYLRAYTSLEQMNWAKLLPSAEYAYNNSRSSSTKVTPFMALYGYNPELRFDIEDNTTKREAPAARDRVIRLKELRDRLVEELLESQERQAKYYNQRHLPKLFKRGDLVKLSTRNLRLKNKKLQPRWIGPIRILERIGSQAYRLALPEKYARLHDVFPIQFIEEYKPRDDIPPLPLPDLEDEEEFEVEEIKDKAIIQGQKHYLVKWEGWPTEYNQWIPEGDMEHARLAIQRYEKNQQKLASK
jgi:Integrase zinc binding domain/Chromo (CHRromatin Organisation MOdifier) domain